MTARILALTLLAGALLACAARAQAPSEELRPGDRVLVRIDGEPELRDTFTVTDARELLMPGFGSVSVAGVARTGVEEFLAQHLAKYLKRGTVHARALVRLSMVGEVEKPGFYAVPTDLVLTDAFMVTGGPTREARIQAIRIEREGAALWQGEALQKALAAGYTVDQFRLRDGDRVVFPRMRREGFTTYLGVILAVPAAIFGITQLFR